MMQEKWKIAFVEPCAKITFNILAELLLLWYSEHRWHLHLKLYHNEFLTLWKYLQWGDGYFYHFSCDFPSSLYQVLLYQSDSWIEDALKFAVVALLRAV